MQSSFNNELHETVNMTQKMLRLLLRSINFLRNMTKGVLKTGFLVFTGKVPDFLTEKHYMTKSIANKGQEMVKNLSPRARQLAVERDGNTKDTLPIAFNDPVECLMMIDELEKTKSEFTKDAHGKVQHIQYVLMAENAEGKKFKLNAREMQELAQKEQEFLVQKQKVQMLEKLYGEDRFNKKIRKKLDDAVKQMETLEFDLNNTKAYQYGKAGYLKLYVNANHTKVVGQIYNNVVNARQADLLEHSKKEIEKMKSELSQRLTKDDFTKVIDFSKDTAYGPMKLEEIGGQYFSTTVDADVVKKLQRMKDIEKEPFTVVKVKDQLYIFTPKDAEAVKKMSDHLKEAGVKDTKWSYYEDYTLKTKGSSKTYKITYEEYEKLKANEAQGSLHNQEFSMENGELYTTLWDYQLAQGKSFAEATKEVEDRKDQKKFKEDQEKDAEQQQRVIKSPEAELPNNDPGDNMQTKDEPDYDPYANGNPNDYGFYDETKPDPQGSSTSSAVNGRHKDEDAPDTTNNDYKEITTPTQPNKAGARKPNDANKLAGRINVVKGQDAQEVEMRSFMDDLNMDDKLDY